MDSSFLKAPVAVPKLSGFDKSHRHLLTSKCGTITPILVDEVIPGTKTNLKVALSATLPPLASETFMNCDVKCEAFFVPMRLLYGGFENWFTDFPVYDFTDTDYKPVLPSVQAVYDTTAPSELADLVKCFGPGTLADYLGMHIASSPQGIITLKFTPLPWLAYHKIYDDWYRATKIQRPLFYRPKSNGSFSSTTFGDDIASGSNHLLSAVPYASYESASAVASSGEWKNALFDDGVAVWQLRQRNFGFDYFTTAMSSPQAGSAIELAVPSPDASGANSFTIAALRLANSFQQFADRNGLPGERFQDQEYARYGVSIKDGVAQRSLFLGSAVFNVYSHGVSENSSTNAPSASQNPFSGQVGAQAGFARASGSEFIIDDFEAKEPGYIFVMATLVPEATYSSGTRKYLGKYIGAGSLIDMGNPILQNAGPQPIYKSELVYNPNFGINPIFGYTDRYAEYKVYENTLSGLVRDGESLESFALQRSFDNNLSVSLGSQFLQIPTTFMDQVTAVSGALSQYGVWIDTYFDYKQAMPLQRYALPTLQDPAYEHGETITIHRGGFRL